MHKIGSEIVKGSDRGDRIGDSIEITGVKVQFYIHNPNTAGADSGAFRYGLIQHLWPGTSLTLNTWEPQNSLSFTPENYTSTDFTQIYRQFNKQAFRVLYDKRGQLNNVTQNDSGSKNPVREFYMPCSILMTFNDEAEADNKILPDLDFFVFVQKDDSTAAFTSNLRVVYTVTTYFNDRR